MRLRTRSQISRVTVAALFLGVLTTRVEAQPLVAAGVRLAELQGEGHLLLNKITPSFSIAPKAIFRRRGARGAMFDYAKQTVWLSTNVHDVLPRAAKPFWPSPVRLSVGRRGTGAGMPADYMVGLDLDAARLPGSHPVWMHTKAILHTLRLPGPAIVMGPAGTRALGLYW